MPDERVSCILDSGTCKPGMSPSTALRSLLMEQLGDLNLTALGGWPEIVDRIVHALDTSGLLPDVRPHPHDIGRELEIIDTRLVTLQEMVEGLLPKPQNAHAGAPDPEKKKKGE